jgi:pyruvate dehydrogenase E2 component (dihydrolipoamide acetyltransferase)
MATRIVVPDAGQTTDELLLAKWHVKVGDQVEVGDFLADIETDKAVGELESHVAGRVLKLLAEEGDTVITGQGLLWIGEPGEEVDDVPEAEVGVEPAPQPHAPRAPEREPRGADVSGTRATPAARMLARERGADLGAIAGTGPEGCVVKRDVLAVAGGAAGDTIRGTSAPLSAMRRAIAARLQESVREAPHFYVSIDVDMSRALALRRALPTRVTVNDIIVKASADALAATPRMNCRLDGDTIHYLREINIGIAVSVDEGLVVPVLARADELTLSEVAARSRELIDNARAGRLAAGVQSTFTVSNLGMYGVKWFSAIINPPEAAILAVGAVEDKLVLGGSGVTTQPTVTLTLSSDHRIVDGELAARFLRAVKERLENPEAPNAPADEEEAGE